MPNLFIAIATGQRVANLPPILEYGRPGDQILWIESPHAKKLEWSRGSRAVLQRHGITTCGEVAVEQINAPGDLAEGLRRALGEARQQNPELHPVVVANGGQKLSPLGLHVGTRDFSDPPPVWLYGENQPASYWLFANGLNGGYQAKRYQHHRLDLADILEVADYQLGPNSSQHPFWPATTPPAAAPDGYASDPERTAERHRRSYHNHQLKALCEESKRVQGVPELELTPANRKKLINSLHRLYCHLEKLRGRRCLDTPGFYAMAQDCDDAILKDLLHGSHLKYQQAVTDYCRSQHALTEGSELPVIGPLFEQAVTLRLYQWLQQNQGMGGVIQSAWHNVRVAHRNAPERVTAEWDLLLVLKNGVLWSLECKAATAEYKDLDARLYNLEQAAGSHLARMALVIPLFSQFSDEAWFAVSHNLRLQVEERNSGMRTLFVGLPGQPDHYVFGESPKSQRYSCPTLEEGLLQIFKGYSLKDIK